MSYTLRLNDLVDLVVTLIGSLSTPKSVDDYPAEKVKRSVTMLSNLINELMSVLYANIYDVNLNLDVVETREGVNQKFANILTLVEVWSLVVDKHRHMFTVDENLKVTKTVEWLRHAINELEKKHKLKEVTE